MINATLTIIIHIGKTVIVIGYFINSITGNGGKL